MTGTARHDDDEDRSDAVIEDLKARLGQALYKLEHVRKRYRRQRRELLEATARVAALEAVIQAAAGLIGR